MTIFQIDNSRPFISVNGLPVQWQTGSAAFMTLSSRLVRINQHGVSFKPKSWHTRAQLGAMPAWESQSCLQSAFGLCSTNNSVMFPSTHTPIVSERLDWICGDATTLRAISNSSRYDVSSCDVLDADMDYVLSDDILYSTGSASMPDWVYWTVCVLVVYLVRCLSKYVLASLSKDKVYPSPWVSILVCCATTVLVTMQGDFMYATEEDLIYYWFVILYICTYCGIFIGAQWLSFAGMEKQRDPPFYNLLSGVLQLVAIRLYCGAETPYNPPILFIVASRVFVKSRRGCDALRSITLLLDSLMLGLGCTLGFSPQSQYLIALAAAAFVASDMLVAA